jgi:hypothetical protein
VRWLKKQNDHSEYAYGKITTINEADEDMVNPYEI